MANVVHMEIRMVSDIYLDGGVSFGPYYEITAFDDSSTCDEYWGLVADHPLSELADTFTPKGALAWLFAQENETSLSVSAMEHGMYADKEWYDEATMKAAAEELNREAD